MSDNVTPTTPQDQGVPEGVSQSYKDGFMAGRNAERESAPPPAPPPPRQFQPGERLTSAEVASMEPADQQRYLRLLQRGWR